MEINDVLSDAGFQFKDSQSAAQIIIAILQELAKDERTQRISEERTAATRPKTEAEPATAAQIKYLEDLGVVPKEGLTKAEASALIAKLKGK
jgi:hypothetical protein